MSDHEGGRGIYVLAHGESGRDRLRVLARVMEEGTIDLLHKIGIKRGARCLDVGCGGGDVSVLLAHQVGPTGRVEGVDFDPVKVAVATREAGDAGIANLSYRTVSVYDLAGNESFDIVTARFLLSHLADPATALARMNGMLRRGGLIVVEDVEFSSHFCFPPCAAMEDYIRLYMALTASTGGDANIGPKLPGMLRRMGLAEVGMQVHQPAGLVGDVKLITPLTMQSIADRVIEVGLADPEDVRRTVEGLMAAVTDPDVAMSTPRVFQSWGRKA